MDEDGGWMGMGMGTEETPQKRIRKEVLCKV